MIKRIYIFFMLLLAANVSLSQLPADEDWNKRLGTIDQSKAKELYEYVFSKDSPIMPGNESMMISLEFYLKIRQLMELAPFSDYSFYSGFLYESNTSMYPRMLSAIEDPAIRMMLVEDVVQQGNLFVDQIDSINVLRETNSATKGDPLSMPLAKIRRAHYNYLFAHNPQYYPERFYDKEKAYQLYREGFKEFLAAKDETDKELHAFYLQEYYKVCEALYKSNEEKYYEQFLTDYQEIVQVCDKLLEPYYDIPDSVLGTPSSHPAQYDMFHQYNGATYGREIKFLGDTIINGKSIQKNDTVNHGVKLMFAASGAATPDRLAKYFSNRLEKNRQNKEYLDNAINMMFVNGFVLDTIFYEYCKASYDLGKTYENCIGLAQAVYLGLTSKDEMRQYYEDALQLSSSEADKAKIRFWIARSLFTVRPIDPATNKNYPYTSPEYQQWQNELEMCNANLNLMLQSKDLLLQSPSLDVRDYVAQAYYMMAENRYHAAAQLQSIKMVDEALIDLQNASQLNMRATSINGRIVNIHSEIERFQDIRPKIQTILKEKRNWAKKQAEYDAYMKKKKAEEDFWKNRANNIYR